MSKTRPTIQHVTEHPTFRAAAERLDALLKRREAAQREFDALLDQWRDASAPGVADILEAAASGRDLPTTRAQVAESIVQRRTALALEIEALNRAEPEARRLVEVARERARLDMLDRHREHVAELRRTFRHGLAMAARAAQAEDLLFAELVSKGFGLHEARSCDAPLAVNRHELLEWVGEVEREAATA